MVELGAPMKNCSKVSADWMRIRIGWRQDDDELDQRSPISIILITAAWRDDCAMRVTQNGRMFVSKKSRMCRNSKGRASVEYLDPASPTDFKSRLERFPRM